MKSLVKIRYIILLAMLVIYSLPSQADCGVTDYSGNSGRLYSMTVYVLDMCTLTLELLNVIAAILAVYSATGIFIKLQAGEEGFTKSIIVLVGSCLFLLCATIVFPAFFGYSYGAEKIF